MIVAARTTAEVQEAVRTQPRLWPRGGGSKPALSTAPADAAVLELEGLTGVLAYEPAEFGFTARAGTRIEEIQALLAGAGQYLPFDPPLAAAGATLGGTVAAGLAGSMRWRYGGIRDFILGIAFVDGRGELIRGGGKVVKNAAGFDLPKLMVGSAGRLGVLTELSFKVFPAPREMRTLRLEYPGLSEALADLVRLASSIHEFYALDLLPPATLALRLGGIAGAQENRLARVESFLDRSGERLAGDEEAGYWRQASEFAWVPAAAGLVKVPLTSERIAALEAALPPTPRRYLAAGNLLYLAWQAPWEDLDELLKAQGLTALALTGQPPTPFLGMKLSQVFGARIKEVLDPEGRFAEV